MQFLGPAEKGMYANGCLGWLSRNRSGLNTSGSGQCSGSLCTIDAIITTTVPCGNILSPEI